MVVERGVQVVARVAAGLSGVQFDVGGLHGGATAEHQGGEGQE